MLRHAMIQKARGPEGVHLQGGSHLPQHRVPRGLRLTRPGWAEASTGGLGAGTSEFLGHPLTQVPGLRVGKTP